MYSVVARQMTSSEPKLSVVVAARNDTYGGNFLERLQLFISTLIAQCNKYNLDCELIIVEWNPPRKQPELARGLEFPENLKSCRIRIIQVPSAIHKGFSYAEKLPLHEMRAKNVGIRRAKGQFVLATNADILFSDELIQFLASSKLNPSKMYRVSRYDVSAKVPIGASVQSRIKFCERHVFRILTRNRDIIKGRRTRFTLRLPATLYFFIVDASTRWTVLLESRRKRGKIFAKEIRMKAGIATTKIKPHLSRYLLPPYPLLHTNACGDFTLMSRANWFLLRGYPELDLYPLNIDSLLLHMAYNLGVSEQELRDPMRIYHMYQNRIEQESITISTTFAERVPFLTFRQVEEWAAKMYHGRRPMIFNDENWGLALEPLSETKR